MNDRAIRTFWAVHCLTCHATFGDWDLDPKRGEIEAAACCPYCHGTREVHRG